MAFLFEDSIGIMWAELRGRVTSLNLVVRASFDAAQYVLGFLDCRYTMPACGQLLIRRSPKSFCVCLLSMISSPSLWPYLGLPQLGCRTLHWAFLNFMRCLWVYFLSLSMSLGVSSLPSVYQLLSLVIYEERLTPTCLQPPFMQLLIRSPFSPLFSRLKYFSSLSCSLWDFRLKPFTRSIALLWTHSSTSIFLVVGAPNTVFEINIIPVI